MPAARSIECTGSPLRSCEARPRLEARDVTEVVL